MKKMMLALAIMVSMSSMAFASEKNVSEKVLTAFKSEFTTAQEVSWIVSDNYYKASFTLSGNIVYAFYSLEGDFMGLSRYMSTSQLPIYLQSSAKKDYSNYWVSDLFEVSNYDGTAYYLTLEDADNKIVLKSTSGKDWNVYKKEKKA